MSVSKEEVTRIAALAALDVADEAMPDLTAQMGRILDYVSQIEAVEADPIAPFRPQSNARPQAMRPDVAVRHTPPLDPRMFAPDVREGLVIVPKIGGLAEDDAG